MSSIIASMIASLFPAPEYRVLMVGLDAAGKTTILYKLKLGEVITTIPTIGFNVETVEYKGVSLTFWDVGGCDKIRPLWRHYYQNTQAIVFVVDSNDRERMMNDDDSGIKKLIHDTLGADELRNALVLFYFNKQDLENPASPAEIVDILGLNSIRSHRIHCQSCIAPRGDGLYEGLDWLISSLKDGKSAGGHSSADEKKKEVQKPLTPEEEAAKRLEDLMIEWLEREDESDDDFLAALENYTLQNWDHRTHLRIAWLILTRHGRQAGLPKIFDLIKNFIANSPRTQRSRGTTFHETMTYFWVHMVHYAIVATKLPQEDFKTFLLMNPQLCNGGLFLHYYTKQRMLHDADARTMVLLPDKLPLPSIIGGGNSSTNNKSSGVAKLVPSAPLTDDEFLIHLRDGTLPGWGHDVKIRAVYLLLCRYGRSTASVDHILDTLSKIEKANTHLTINYFWIQMVTYHIQQEMKDNKAPTTVFNAFNNASYVVPPISDSESVIDAMSSMNVPFAKFYQLPHCQALRNQLLYEKYYSRDAIDDKASETSMVLPNLKPFPKFV